MTLQEYKNELKELRERLEKLEATKVEEPQPKRWKPQDDEPFWYVGYDGTVYNSDFGFDYEWLYLTGNCFRTEEEAREYKKQIEYTAFYKNYIEEHSEPIDWHDDNEMKYFACFSFVTGGIETNWCSMCKNQGTVYASNDEIIWNAIRAIGEDNFKKYVLGVK